VISKAGCVSSSPRSTRTADHRHPHDPRPRRYRGLCTRVMVIDHGHQIFDGTLAGLRGSQSPRAPSSSTWPPPSHPSR
jgi:hypothetical protein